MGRSIIETIGLAVTLAFAVPIALLGIDWLLAGRHLGIGFVVLAVLMVLLEEYVFDPRDLPGAVLRRTVGWLVTDPDDEES